MSGVGHFVDEASRTHFLDAYRAAMADMPPPSATLDVPTTFGTVRAYRYDGPTSATPAVFVPGRNASTPMWAPNLAGVVAHRTAFCLDLLGEAGMSVQTIPIRTPTDQAGWLGQDLAGFGLERTHLVGASIGGWAAVNLAVHEPRRLASLSLLDPVMTFGRIPAKTLLASVALTSPFVPEAVRRRTLRWISGGADVDDSVSVARLIAAASVDFVIRLPAPSLITDAQLRALRVPVLAVLAGRSVMLDTDRAARRARNLLQHSKIDVWADASHALTGEYPERIAACLQEFWGWMSA